MRIMLLNTDFETGGTPHYVRDLTLGLSKCGFCVEAACLAGSGPVADQLMKEGIATHCLGAKGAWDFSVLFRLARIIRRFQPHILHSSLVHANFAARVAGKCCGVPHGVATIHTAEQGKRWHFLLENLLCRWSDTTVCVSRSVFDYMSKTAHIPSGRMKVIANGIDIRRFIDAQPLDLTPYGIAFDAVKLIFVGRLDPVKNLDVLLRAFVGLEGNPVLIIVGDGPEREKLERLCRELGLTSKVHFVGRQQNIEQWLKAVDIYVQPSRWEGMSLSALEAMASGLPVLAGRVSGLIDLIDHKENGILVDPHNPAEIRSYMRLLVKNGQLRCQLGQNAKRKVGKSFSHELMLKHYIKLYHGLISG